MSTTLHQHPAIFPSVVAAAAVLLVSAAPARAQVFESVGIRAQGLGGAFVAVADDASATWWNPAGLAGGAYVNAILDAATAQDPRAATDAAGAATQSSRTVARGFSVAYPVLGLSYYRLRVSELRPTGPTAGQSPGRQDQGRAPVRLSSLVLQQFGATVGQSIGDHLVVASTVKLVRGALATSVAAAADASLDRASGLEGEAETHGDLDVGAMAAFGRFRLGLAVKNVTEPGFTSGADRADLRRQARAGLAVTTSNLTSVGGFTVALDADLTRTSTPTGETRRVAAGVEGWTASRRVALRGGVSANTVGEARPAASGGVSVAVRSGLYVDGQATQGADRARKGWGLALRMTF